MAAESEPMEGVSQAEVLSVPDLNSHPSYGSRLAMSLGDLDLPQLLAERDLHQGDLAMSPSVKSEPEAFGGVLGNSLMLNNIGGSANLPPHKIVQAGSDPNMASLMHSLAHWSDRARQARCDISHQDQSYHGHMPHVQPGFHQQHLDSQHPTPHGVDLREAFRVPPGGYRIPHPGASLGPGNPRITSGATLDPVTFHDSSRPTAARHYTGHDGVTLGNTCRIQPMLLGDLALHVQQCYVTLVMLWIAVW